MESHIQVYKSVFTNCIFSIIYSVIAIWNWIECLSCSSELRCHPLAVLKFFNSNGFVPSRWSWEGDRAVAVEIFPSDPLGFFRDRTVYCTDCTFLSRLETCNTNTQTVGEWMRSLALSEIWYVSHVEAVQTLPWRKKSRLCRKLIERSNCNVSSLQS